MASGKLGKPSWSAGLTASTDVRIATMAANARGRTRGPYKTANGRPRIRSTGDFLPLPESIEPDYVYLLGMYLGDGYVVRVNRSWAFRVYLDSTQTRIIERCRAALVRMRPDNKIGLVVKKEGVTVVRSYGELWPCLFPQHGPGRKHERRIALEDWQRALVMKHPQLFLRGLIESDGCRFDRIVDGKAYPAYEFTNRSADILELFTWACGLLGISYTRSSAVDVSIARRRDVSLLDEFIGPKT